MRHRTTIPTPARHSAGLTLVALAVTLSLAGTLLAGLTLVNRTVRHDAAEAQTRQTLVLLQHAVRTYHDDHGRAPAGTAETALSALLTHPASAEWLADVEVVHDDQGQPLVRDGFGRPMRYQAVDDSQAAAGFVSAGRSGRFGDLHASDTAAHRAAADNLYGFELEVPRP